MDVVADSGRRARPLRIQVSDGWYPVMSRATCVGTVFRRDEDRRRFMRLVSELPERFGVRRFWRRAESQSELGDFLERMRVKFHK